MLRKIIGTACFREELLALLLRSCLCLLCRLGGSMLRLRGLIPLCRGLIPLCCGLVYRALQLCHLVA